MKSEIETGFEVGQVVFFIASKTESVITALIAEKIVRTRIDGEQIGYVLHVKTTKGMEKVEVDPSNTKLYSSLESVRAYMLELASAAIDNLVSRAASAAAEISAAVKPSSGPDLQEAMNLQPDDSSTLVELEDGRLAKVRIS